MSAWDGRGITRRYWRRGRPAAASRSGPATRGRQLETSRAMPEVYFGTASFAYEGWKGIVYHDRYPASRFTVDSLREYARSQPFRTVEFDFPFYRPPDDRQLARY